MQTPTLWAHISRSLDIALMTAMLDGVDTNADRALREPYLQLIRSEGGISPLAGKSSNCKTAIKKLRGEDRKSAHNQVFSHAIPATVQIGAEGSGRLNDAGCVTLVSPSLGSIART